MSATYVKESYIDLSADSLALRMHRLIWSYTVHRWHIRGDACVAERVNELATFKRHIYEPRRVILGLRTFFVDFWIFIYVR